MMLQRKIPTIKNILHSIPIGSIMVLLLLLSFLVNPNIYYSNNSVYAAEDDNVSNSINNTSTHANDEESSTSLIIGGAEMNEVVDASVGEVAYRKHTVTISASKLKSYTLFISGPEGLNGETVITGANGNTPVDMPKNSWGYAYGQDGNENNMTYSSFTNNAKLIDSKLESESTVEDTDFTKNLIFAVKFGNAIAGHYTGTVTLSLAAEPKEIVTPTTPVYEWDKLEYMQQMTPEACSQATKATSSNYADIQKVLTDSRDGSTYTVRKLDDDKCWMTQNLRIVNKKIDSTDSNLAEGATYTIPASSSPWPTTGVDTSELNKRLVHYAGNSTNGANYTWCTATAGTCLQGLDSEIRDKDAPASICPRGWRLPTRAEYTTLLSNAGIGNDKAGSTKIRGLPYNFPYAGQIANRSLSSIDSRGSYWSSTSYTRNFAYVLTFFSDGVGTNYPYRYYGLSIRCIAE